MAFISKITEYIVDNYDLTKDYLTIIFPNKRAALTLRNELSKRINYNIWLPDILSIQEAMSQWSGLNLADNVDAIFELIKIINKNNDFSSRKDLFSLASQMIKDFDEIDQYEINAKKFFNFLAEVKEIENWTPDLDNPIESSYLHFFKSLYNYYLSLRDVLSNEKCGYYGMITRYIDEMSDDKLISIIGNKKIIFAGFNAMTKSEESVIVRLVECNKAVLLWDLDKYYFEDEKQEAGLFAREFFKNHPRIKKTFLSDNFSDKKNINIIGVSGNSVQTNALQIQLLKDDKNTQNKKAIVLADEKLLIPVLNSIPHNYDDLQVTMGYPYSKTIINHFIIQLFSFQNFINEKDNTIYFWGLLKLMGSELSKILLTPPELKDFLTWKEDKISKSTYYIKIDDYDYFKTHNNIYEFLKLISIKWKSSNECINSIKLILKLIYKLISDNDKSNFLKNQISIAGRIINKIEKLLFKYNILIDIRDIESLYKQSSQEMSINLKGNINGLQIMGLLETRNLDFDTIHILSVNEGILPQSKNNNSLIPFDLRKNFGLPTYKNKQAVYAYHFYRLLQNANNINIYYNTLADGMGEGEASRFIRQILHEMPYKSKNINIIESFYKCPEIKQQNNKANISIEKNERILSKIEEKLLDLSPTSISCYLNCKMQFYIKYIENINDTSTDESIQSNVIGNIIHSTFQFLYEHFGDNIIDLKLYEQVVDKFLCSSYQKALIKNNFPDGLPENGFNYLSKKMIEKLINNFINTEITFLKNNTIKIIGLEQKLSHTFCINGKNARIIGFADRIDSVNDTIRVLDYKTGQIYDEDVKIKNNIDNLKDLKDKSLQLITYKYLYAKSTNTEIKKIKPGIFGLRKMSKGIFQLDNQSETFDNDNFLNSCDRLFEDLIIEISDKNIPFSQTDNADNCKNCDYKDICKR